MNYSMYLYARAELESAQPDHITRCLADAGFIGASLEENIYEAGNNLINLINYLGCSPTLRSGTLDCQLTIHHHPHTTGMGGNSIESLRYPRCGHRISEPGMLVAGFEPTTEWNCEECENSGQLKDINWRRAAGFSSLFIEITPIFPKEALPGKELLTILSRCSKQQWSWFYSRASAEILTPNL